MDVLIEMRTQLRFRDAANGGVRLSHGYIVQIVEVAEDAYLPNLVTPVSRAKRIALSIVFNTP